MNILGSHLHRYVLCKLSLQIHFCIIHMLPREAQLVRRQVLKPAYNPNEET